MFEPRPEIRMATRFLMSALWQCGSRRFHICRQDSPPLDGEGLGAGSRCGLRCDLGTPTPDPSPRRVEDAPSARWGGEPLRQRWEPAGGRSSRELQLARVAHGFRFTLSLGLRFDATARLDLA